MRDELFDRDYQAGRADFNAGIDRTLSAIGKTVGDSLKVLHRLEWNAPWQSKSKRIGRA
jgi:hypothetical protein